MFSFCFLFCSWEPSVEDDAPVIRDADISLEFYVPEGKGIKTYKISMRVTRLDQQEVGLQVEDYDDKTVNAMRSILLYAVIGMQPQESGARLGQTPVARKAALN